MLSSGAQERILTEDEIRQGVRLELKNDKDDRSKKYRRVRYCFL